MKLLILIVMIVTFMIIITTMKLMECGVSGALALIISFKMPKIIKNTSVKLFDEYKSINIIKAFRYLLSPLRYKSYLEIIAESVIYLECTLEVISEIKSELTKAELNTLNKWIKSKGFAFEVNKNKEIVCYKGGDVLNE